MREALHDFIETIEATGGCVRDEGDTVAPAGGPDWLDLADVYLRACKAGPGAPDTAGPMPKRSETKGVVTSMWSPTRPGTTPRRAGDD